MAGSDGKNPPPMPENEEQRLEFLRRLDLISSPPEESFDRLTTLAARMLDTPIAQVTIVAEGREVFVSCYGSESTDRDRERSICSRGILEPDEPTVIEDVVSADRFGDEFAQIDGETYRAYAGIPITVQGFSVGSFCVRDREPREFIDDEITDLRTIT
ncbi:MAG: GAF domain-containing protein, partial [bacterium]